MPTAAQTQTPPPTPASRPSPGSRLLHPAAPQTAPWSLARATADQAQRAVGGGGCPAELYRPLSLGLPLVTRTQPGSKAGLWGPAPDWPPAGPASTGGRPRPQLQSPARWLPTPAGEGCRGEAGVLALFPGPSGVTENAAIEGPTLCSLAVPRCPSVVTSATVDQRPEQQLKQEEAGCPPGLLSGQGSRHRGAPSAGLSPRHPPMPGPWLTGQAHPRPGPRFPGCNRGLAIQLPRRCPPTTYHSPHHVESPPCGGTDSAEAPLLSWLG